MRLFRQISLLFTVIAVFTAPAVAAQSTPTPDLITQINSAEESYVQVIADTSPAAGADHSVTTSPAMATVLLVTESEDQGSSLFDVIREASNESVSAPTQSIDDLGDEAMLIFPGDGDDVTLVAVAREGNVIVMSSAANWPVDSTTPVDVVRHILEHGPGDEPYTVDSEGLVSGGWSSAFPQPGAFEDFEGFKFMPITLWADIPTPVAVTPVVRPITEATPDESDVYGQTPIVTMLTQNYIDMSDAALDSGTKPEIVMITVMQLDSEAAASDHFNQFTNGRDFQSTGTITEIENVGYGAVFVESVDEGGDHGAWMVARVENVVITAFVTGAPDAPEIAQDIVTHIVETGPSDQPLEISADGIATGSWADAFPQPEDIDGLAHLDPQPVTEFRDSDTPPVATPSN